MLPKKHFASTHQQEEKKISLVIFHWNFFYEGTCHGMSYTVDAFRESRKVGEHLSAVWKRRRCLKHALHSLLGVHASSFLHDAPIFYFCSVSIHEIHNVSKFCCQSSLPHEYNSHIFLRSSDENYVLWNIMPSFFMDAHIKNKQIPSLTL